MKQIKRKYGCIPDLPDHRDYSFEKIVPRITLPTSVDLSAKCSVVEDQGQLGSCTANALVGALEFLEMKAKLPFVDMSRLFVYYNERALEGTINSDSGAQIKDGIKVLASQGCCQEKSWPYVISKFSKKPSKACYTKGLQHTIQEYYRINGLLGMKQCLALGFPFVFGFSVYESFESATVAKTGVVPMPKHSESCLGGHAVLAVGYDDKTSRFLVRNSWGPNWGLKGYFTIPYTYLTNSNLASDFWYIVR